MQKHAETTMYINFPYKSEDFPKKIGRQRIRNLLIVLLINKIEKVDKDYSSLLAKAQRR